MSYSVSSTHLLRHSYSMTASRILQLVVLLLFCATLSLAQQQQQPASPPALSPSAPEDKPQALSAEQVKKFEEAIKPYVEKARKTYPDARKRFLAGLPPKHSFYITTRLHDEQGRFEQVFIAVKEIKEGTIKGIIASDITTITKYKFGDLYSFPESELMDWTIALPDGSEEGNFVGKFLDEYKP
jgi:hypothetical protein